MLYKEKMLSMKDKNKVIDPVCGRKIKKSKAFVVIHHMGEQYYICSPKCEKLFKESRKKYLHRNLEV
jgi:YHS domain-containing protein